MTLSRAVQKLDPVDLVLTGRQAADWDAGIVGCGMSELLGWPAVTFAGIGLAPSFPLILILAGLAGLGSGAFHPFGALNANAVITPGKRNAAMSVYASGGTLGFAIGPLIGVALLALLGQHGIALMLIPGSVIAGWLLYEMRTIAVKGRSRGGTIDAAIPPIPKLAMAAVIIVMMSRSWTMSSIQAFVPTWYDDLGYSTAFYGALATTYVRAFDDKWLRQGATSAEPLLGSADIQSLADLTSSCEVIAQMRPVPLSMRQALAILIITALPAAPLVLFVAPFDELILRGLRTLLHV